MAFCFRGKDHVGEIKSGVVFDPENRMLDRTITFDGNFDLGSRDAPVRPFSIASGDAAFFDHISVGPGFFHRFAADVVMVLFKKNLPPGDPACLGLKIKDRFPGSQDVAVGLEDNVPLDFDHPCSLVIFGPIR